jgi:hypothetical protein
MSTLTRIVTEAKRIRRLHPSKHSKWTDYIKDASKKIKKKKPKSRKVSGVRRTSTLRKKVARVKKIHRQEGAAIKKLGSVGSHLSHARSQLKEEIGWNQASLLTAKTAKSKRRLKKIISKKLKTYRMLCR